MRDLPSWRVALLMSNVGLTPKPSSPNRRKLKNHLHTIQREESPGTRIESLVMANPNSLRPCRPVAMVNATRPRQSGHSRRQVPRPREGWHP